MFFKGDRRLDGNLDKLLTLSDTPALVNSAIPANSANSASAAAPLSQKPGEPPPKPAYPPPAALPTQLGSHGLRHEYSAEGKPVLILFPVGTLGDTLGWFPYAVKFQAKHKCRLTCAMAERLIPMFRASHPEIEFISHEEVEADRYYATYCIGLF